LSTNTTTEYGADGFPPIVWVDVETTGLDPDWDQLLEVAIVITDSELEPQGVFDSVIRQPELVSMKPVVREMHKRSGLIDEVLSPEAPSLPEVYASVVKFLAGNGVTKESPLAGSSVGFDKSFLRRDMPGVLRLMHYRVIDVSGLRELVARWHGEKWQKKDVHRAKDDILDSIKELRHYRRVFGL
jgi:oligoribonuclease